jgi:UPF0042 nucleotide-binding protein
MSRKRVILITGLSGSGKSTAARALEDEGFFVVDNLPLALLPQFLGLAAQGVRFTSEVAVVIDVRNRDFLAGFEPTLQEVREAGHSLEIFFFDAGDEVLLRRYSETRRRHPLAPNEAVAEGIGRERQLLEGLRQQATQVVDSSRLTPHQLRQLVVQLASGEAGSLPLVVQLQSFGFRYGIPPDSDLVLDVRFLPNPHFIPELQPLTGLDQAVAGYVLTQEASRDFLRHLQQLLRFLLPHYRREGKSYLTISIGCTGGRHRSVAVVEGVRPFLQQQEVTLQVVHRDISKG